MSILIKHKKMTIPIVQGGMGIGISMGELAGEVAKQGGMGTISFVNCGYKEKDFYKNPIEANKRAFVKNLKKAQEISNGNGIIIVNLMHVINNFTEYLNFINTTKIDGVVVGAGLPLELPKYIDKEKIIAPIISSARALKILMKKWIKNFNRRPDFIIFEGPKAGGHLGFKKEELNIDIQKELREIIKIKEEFEEKHIPLFIGGGFGSKKAIDWALENGADGVQIGTGFLFTNESGMEKNAKIKLLEMSQKKLINNEIIQSPVGLFARSLNTKFVEKVKSERVSSSKCINCISTCNPSNTPYCINEALIRAVKGDLNEGLYFSGTDIENIDKVVSVEEYISNLIGDDYE